MAVRPFHASSGVGDTTESSHARLAAKRRDRDGGHRLDRAKAEPATPATTIHEVAEIPEGQIRTTILRELFALANAAGFPPHEWCPPEYIGSEDDQPPPHLKHEEACAIIRAAIERLPISGLGLQTGLRQNIGHFGAVGLAMFSAPTFGEAVRLGLRYAPIAGVMVHQTLESITAGDGFPGGLAIVISMYQDDSAIEPFLCEEYFASCISLCRGLLGPGFRAERIEMRQPRPSHAEALFHHFACEVRFASERNLVVLSDDWLSRTMPAYHPDNAEQTLALCRAQLPEHEAPGKDRDIVRVVEELLHEHLGSRLHLDEIADCLHMTERTLRRRLRSAQTSWRDILDRVRCETADRMLRAGATSIADIGAAVGFSDTREFRRAFKRWTGKTPSEHISTHLHGKTE